MLAPKVTLLVTTALSWCQGHVSSADDSNTRLNIDYGVLNKYFVYNLRNPRNPFVLTSSTISSAPISSTRNTAVLVHGLKGSYQNSFSIVLKDAFLNHDANNDDIEIDIIVLDWEHVSTLNSALELIPQVANALAGILRQLEAADLVNLSQLHLVGFGFGAHLVGITGRILNGQVARITGLDPSGGDWKGNAQQLAPRDARYVEVIHTDMLGRKSLGTEEALGHVDFYPNGGIMQPGCFRNKCYHERAWELFAATLTHPNTLVANRCISINQVVEHDWGCTGISLEMGGSILYKLASGLFRINTGSVYPYNLN